MNTPALVTVTGASSQLGVFLLPRLQDAGFAVRAVSRRAPVAGLEISEQVSWVNPLLELELAAGKAPADFLVSCGPLSLARKLLQQKQPFQSAVVFSTSSILTKPDSADAWRTRPGECHCRRRGPGKVGVPGAWHPISSDQANIDLRLWPGP